MRHGRHRAFHIDGQLDAAIHDAFTELNVGAFTRAHLLVKLGYFMAEGFQLLAITAKTEPRLDTVLFPILAIGFRQKSKVQLGIAKDFVSKCQHP